MTELFFLKKYVENETGRQALDLFLLFKRALYEIKVSGLHLSFNIFG